jgi:hypothetical protein
LSLYLSLYLSLSLSSVLFVGGRGAGGQGADDEQRYCRESAGESAAKIAAA